MSNKLSICAVIKVDSIAFEGNGITHRLRIVRSFCFVVFPYEAFWFRYICCTFYFLMGQVTFVGYIGCNVPFWNFFSDILELGTYSECYCFVIPIIILVSTFFVLLCSEWFAQSFKGVNITYFCFSVFNNNFEQIIILLFLILCWKQARWVLPYYSI